MTNVQDMNTVIHTKQIDDETIAVWYSVGNVIYLEFAPDDFGVFWR